MAKAVVRLKELTGREFPKVLELGSQTLTAKIATNPEPKTAPEFYQSVVGARAYDAIDTDGRGTINLDLNRVHDLKASYDLVTNNGTGEHIFNQAAVFETLHLACKTGGIILCVLPWVNWRNHGFYNFHPLLFKDLAEVNGYEIIASYAADRNGNVTHDHLEFSEIKKPEPTDINISLVVAMRKLKDGDFKYPIQGKYRTGGGDAFNFHGMFKRAVVELDPFPHAVFTLDPGLFTALDAAWPSTEVIVRGREKKSNLLLQYSVGEILAEDKVGPLWRSAMEYLTSDGALQEYLRLFGKAALARYPQLSSYPLEAGVRFRDQAVFQLDAQFAVNTPVKKASSVRGPHIDDPKQLFGGLLYFDGDGADLELYRWKKGRSFWKREGYGKAAECDPGAVEVAVTVDAAPGTCVLFLNTPDSIHGVTPRKKTKNYRRYLNLVCEVGQPLFELK